MFPSKYLYQNKMTKGKTKMDEQVWELVGWIYQHYGRTGCAVAFLIMVSVLALAYYLLNKLPEAKTQSEPKGADSS